MNKDDDNTAQAIYGLWQEYRDELAAQYERGTRSSEQSNPSLSAFMEWVGRGL